MYHIYYSFSYFFVVVLYSNGNEGKRQASELARKLQAERPFSHSTKTMQKNKWVFAMINDREEERRRRYVVET